MNDGNDSITSWMTQFKFSTMKPLLSKIFFWDDPAHRLGTIRYNEKK